MANNLNNANAKAVHKWSETNRLPAKPYLDPFNPPKAKCRPTSLEKVGLAFPCNVTPEKAANIIDLIALGIPPYTASTLNFVSNQVMSDWRQSDSGWAGLISAAVSEWETDSLFFIDQSGSYQARQWRMEKNPETRPTYAQQAQGGSGIQVIINVDRGDLVMAVSAAQQEAEQVIQAVDRPIKIGP